MKEIVIRIRTDDVNAPDGNGFAEQISGDLEDIGVAANVVCIAEGERNINTTQKMDTKFTGVLVKVKDGSIVGDDEYVVFLVKDNAFAGSDGALAWYRTRCVELDCDAEQLDAVDQLVVRAEGWRIDHRDRLKNPDAAGEKMLDVVTEGSQR